MSDPEAVSAADDQQRGAPPSADSSDGSGSSGPKKRRRGSRGGRNKSRSTGAAQPDGGAGAGATAGAGAAADRMPDELPERIGENRPRNVEVAEQALVRRKPQIGDSMPAPVGLPTPKQERAEREQREQRDGGDGAGGGSSTSGAAKRRRRRGGKGRSGGGAGGGGAKRNQGAPIEAITGDAVELDEDELDRRRGRERKGRPVGRYLMAVHVQPGATQIAVLEGRALLEHYVSRPSDDVTQIHGNIYLGKVQNVLPGMEAAFIDIGTPKNAVLYRGDVQYDAEDIEEKGEVRIEHVLKPRQSILCQVTKNPIGAKGARLTQEVSLPGRFVVLIPNSKTYGISKRLGDEERKRLRNILEKVRGEGHGIIVRTAAENVTAEEIERDIERLRKQWERIDALAKKSQAPALLYREPDMAVRVIREEFSKDYRGIVIDDRELYEEVSEYVASISPALAERVEYYDPAVEPLPMYERYHVHEQLHKALDRKVWLPSGGSLIIERTEALTVIDVNTGKNVGTSSLEETVFRNNLEAAEEVARQLRLRDIGGIIVIDFIDMEIKENRESVIRAFRDALARDKTRTQVFDISELGLVEMTRKRIGEGLIESFSSTCPTCEGRGLVFDEALVPD